MIRHYDEAELIRPATRTESNYRVYTAKDVEVLRLVRRARHLGFSTKQIAEGGARNAGANNTESVPIAKERQDEQST